MIDEAIAQLTPLVGTTKALADDRGNVDFGHAFHCKRAADGLVEGVVSISDQCLRWDRCCGRK